MHTYIYGYNWQHHPPQTIYISTRGKGFRFLIWTHSGKAKQMELLEEAACLLKCHGYTEIKQKMKGKKTFSSE